MTTIVSTQLANWLDNAREQLIQRQSRNPFPSLTIEHTTYLGKQLCEVLESQGGIRTLEAFQALELKPNAQFKADVARATELAEFILAEMLTAVGNADELLTPTACRVVGVPFNARSIPDRVELKELWQSVSCKRYLARHCSGVSRVYYSDGAHGYRLQINKAYVMAMEWALRNM